jgi:putative acetyltransferase
VSDSPEIRGATPADAEALEALYPRAFPDEDLLPLVRELSKESGLVLSLVAANDSRIVGHAAFTACGIDGTDARASLLGPVAVDPGWQRKGIGSALIRAGLERLEGVGVAVVCVLGDPAYYGRLGFSKESRIEPPYRLPDEWGDAWQAQCLDEAAEPPAGKLSVAPPWRDPSLWSD